jgi:surface antigen
MRAQIARRVLIATLGIISIQLCCSAANARWETRSEQQCTSQQVCQPVQKTTQECRTEQVCRLQPKTTTNCQTTSQCQMVTQARQNCQWVNECNLGKCQAVHKCTQMQVPQQVCAPRQVCQPVTTSAQVCAPQQVCSPKTSTTQECKSEPRCQTVNKQVWVPDPVQQAPIVNKGLAPATPANPTASSPNPTPAQQQELARIKQRAEEIQAKLKAYQAQQLPSATPNSTQRPSVPPVVPSAPTGSAMSTGSANQNKTTSTSGVQQPSPVETQKVQELQTYKAQLEEKLRGLQAQKLLQDQQKQNEIVRTDAARLSEQQRQAEQRKQEQLVILQQELELRQKQMMKAKAQDKVTGSPTGQGPNQLGTEINATSSPTATTNSAFRSQPPVSGSTKTTAPANAVSDLSGNSKLPTSQTGGSRSTGSIPLPGNGVVSKIATALPDKSGGSAGSPAWPWKDRAATGTVPPKDSAVGYGYCTDYIKNTYKTTTGTDLGLGGHAKDWIERAKAQPDRFTVLPASDIAKAPPGAIAVWSGGSYGHVGFVDSNDGKNSVTFAEANWGPAQKTGNPQVDAFMKSEAITDNFNKVSINQRSYEGAASRNSGGLSLIGFILPK